MDTSAILPGHAPLISELAPGVLRYVQNGATVNLVDTWVDSSRFWTTMFACWRMRGCARKRSTWRTPGQNLKRAQDMMSNPSDIDPAQALEDSLKAQALIDTAGR